MLNVDVWEGLQETPEAIREGSVLAMFTVSPPHPPLFFDTNEFFNTSYKCYLLKYM